MLFTVMTTAAVIVLIVVVCYVGAVDSSRFDFLQEPATPQPTPVQNADGSTTHTVEIFDPRNFFFGLAGFYGLPFVVALFLWGTALWHLLSKATAAWFHFAAAIRAEHRSVRERLAE